MAVGRTVASKVLTILDTFAAASGPVTLTEVSHRSGLPLTTVHRITTDLIEWGGIEREATGLYAIGPRIWEIGSHATRRAGLRELAMPLMADLYETTHENVQLVVLDHQEALCVERIRGRRSLPIVTRVGGRLPLHATAVGKIILAFSSHDFVERVISNGLARYTDRTIVTPEHLRRALKMARLNGYAIAHGELTDGALSVAAPVFSHDGSVHAALALVVSREHAEITPLAIAVKGAAAALSRGIAEANHATADAW